MNRFRPATALIVGMATAALSLAACSSSGSSTPTGSAVTSSVQLYAAIPTENSGIWAKFKSAVDGIGTSTKASSTNFVVDNFNPQKQLQLLTPLFAKGCASCAMSIIPISPSNERPLVTQATNAKTYVTVQYIETTNYLPWDAGRYFVAYMGYDGVDGAYQTAKSLFQRLGGSGNIIALQGTPGPGSGNEKQAGFNKALKEFPGIHVLSQQVADWQEQVAQNMTQTLLTKYGSQIGGIWTANDAMAVGAVEALRAKKLNGKVPVTGMDGGDDTLALIKSGDMLTTMEDSGAQIGSLGAALAYAAAVGDIDPDKLTHEQRYFYLKHELVTKANVDDYLGKPIDPTLLDYNQLKKNFWAYSSGAISVSSSS